MKGSFSLLGKVWRLFSNWQC